MIQTLGVCGARPNIEPPVTRSHGINTLLGGDGECGLEEICT